MTHDDHVALLREGVPEKGGDWADLGSGDGAFTLALAELVGPSGRIHSIDQDSRALRRQRDRMRSRFPDAQVRWSVADFTAPLDLPPLDGVVMANSLHFVERKLPMLEAVRGYLRPEGAFLLVEYDADRGNPWVPYPISFHAWEALAARGGFRETRLLRRIPSRFLGAIYSALSLRDR